MAKYGDCLTWNDFYNSVQNNKNSGRATEKIDYLLIEGGRIKNNIHEKIKNDKNINGYGSHGQFFKGSGESRDPQQRTFFGHIAHLIIDEGCVLKFGDIILDKSINNGMMNDIKRKYENDEVIKIIGFRGDINDKIDSVNIENSFKEYVPTESYVETLLKKIDSRREGVTEEFLFSSIEKDFSEQGKKLKSDWKSRVKRFISKR